MILLAILTIVMAVVATFNSTVLFLYYSGRLLLTSKRMYIVLVFCSFVSFLLLGNLSSQLFKGLAALT